MVHPYSFFKIRENLFSAYIQAWVEKSSLSQNVKQ